MDPFRKLWWFIHRATIDNEIVMQLSKEQRTLLYEQAFAAQRRSMLSWRYFWMTVVQIVLIIGMGWLIFGWGVRYTGRLVMLITIPMAFVAFSMWHWRQVHARSAYRTLRLFGYEICLNCGYWLRSLDEHIAKCPECGWEREHLQSPINEQSK